MTLKEEIRAKLRLEKPDMTDEQFENEWGLVVALGLDEDPEGSTSPSPGRTPPDQG
jgi:hypothetical protein